MKSKVDVAAARRAARTKRAKKFYHRIGTHSRLVDEEIEALAQLRKWIEGEVPEVQLRKAACAYVKALEAYEKATK